MHKKQTAGAGAGTCMASLQQTLQVEETLKLFQNQHFCSAVFSNSNSQCPFRTQPFWSFPSTSPVILALAAAASVLIFVVPRPRPPLRPAVAASAPPVGEHGH